MKLEHITKKYGSNVVLNDIDFDFGDSRIVGLIGKNGVGKTTVMKVMARNIDNIVDKVNIDNANNIDVFVENLN